MDKKKPASGNWRANEQRDLGRGSSAIVTEAGEVGKLGPLVPFPVPESPEVQVQADRELLRGDLATFAGLHGDACGCGEPLGWLCDCADNAMLGWCCRHTGWLVLFRFSRRCVHIEALEAGDGDVL